MKSINNNKVFWILFAIFIFTLSFRLYFSFSNPYVSLDDSFLALRQINHIIDTGYPIINDNLSYGGRVFIFTPLFYYLLALFAEFFKLELVAKILPNVFASSLVFIVYLISRKITNNIQASLFTALISGFIPIFLFKTTMSVSDFSLIIPLFFLYFYNFITLSERNIIYFILLTIFLPLISPSVVVLLFAIILYFMIIKIEKLNISKLEFEGLMFSIVMIIWVLLLILKRAIFSYGTNIIFQNVPEKLLPLYFSNIGILDAVSKIGFLPFLFGIYIMYKYIFKYKNKIIYFLISLIITLFFGLYFRLLSPDLGLMYLGVSLTLVFSQFIKLLFIYFDKTKFSYYKKMLVVGLLVVIFLTSIIPSIYLIKTIVVPTSDEVKALNEISGYSETGGVLVPYQMGELVNYYSNKSNIMDSNFLLIKDVKYRYQDIDDFYNAQFITNAIGILNKYDVNYVLISPRVLNLVGLDNVKILGDPCFNLIYDVNDVKVYDTKCKLK